MKGNVPKLTILVSYSPDERKACLASIRIWEMRLLPLAMSQNEKCMGGDENNICLTVGWGLC